MNTNSFSIADSFSSLSDVIFSGVSTGLDGVSSNITDNAWSDTIVAGLGVILGSLLVIWGVFWVARKLLRAVRATK